MLTDSFQRMLVISTVTGAACGLVGMYSSYFAAVPSGTMIVLTGAAVFCVALAWQGWRSLTRTVGFDDHPTGQAADNARSRSAT
jgi:ABC-type Mn2+/Zn2+ transport system permease subunit